MGLDKLADNERKHMQRGRMSTGFSVRDYPDIGSLNYELAWWLSNLSEIDPKTPELAVPLVYFNTLYLQYLV